MPMAQLRAPLGPVSPEQGIDRCDPPRGPDDHGATAAGAGLAPDDPGVVGGSVVLTDGPGVRRLGQARVVHLGTAGGRLPDDRRLGFDAGEDRLRDPTQSQRFGSSPIDRRRLQRVLE